MAVSAKYNLLLEVNETLTLSEDQSTDPTLLHTIAGGSGTLNATSTVPATKPWSDDVQLSGGAVTLDLTALARPVLANVDFTGLKVQLFKAKADATNTSAVKIDVGATNGYNIFGAATSEVDLFPGDQCLFQFTDQLPDVGSGAKDIDLSSSDVDAKIIFELVAG